MLLQKLFLFSLLALLFSQQPTNSKQELNDQLYEAVRKGDVAAVTSLLDRGADVNAKFRYGATALFKAAERGNLEVVRVLLDRGADPKIKDTFYNATAMTWAMDNQHIEVVKLLLQKGAEEVDEGLMLGTRQSHPELVKIALERGPKPETMTLALAVSDGNEKNAGIVEMLKKAGAVPPPEIDAATLQSYAGTYKEESGREILVSFKDGKLYALLGAQTRPLMALDKTTFRPTAFGGVRLIFNVEAGKVTGLAVKQGQNTTQLKRVVETKQ